MIRDFLVPVLAMTFGGLAGLLIASALTISRLSRTLDQLAIATEALDTVWARVTAPGLRDIIADAMERIREAGE